MISCFWATQDLKSQDSHKISKPIYAAGRDKHEKLYYYREWQRI